MRPSEFAVAVAEQVHALLTSSPQAWPLKDFELQAVSVKESGDGDGSLEVLFRLGSRPGILFGRRWTNVRALTESASLDESAVDAVVTLMWAHLMEAVDSEDSLGAMGAEAREGVVWLPLAGRRSSG